MLKVKVVYQFGDYGPGLDGGGGLGRLQSGMRFVLKRKSIVFTLSDFEIY